MRQSCFNSFYIPLNFGRTIEAKLNTKKKPHISVTVVNKGLDTSAGSNLNRFKIESGLSRKEWINKGWIFKEDPLGWFQWYCRFKNGRRILEIDQIQIKRWKSFGGRHKPAVQKNCEEGKAIRSIALISPYF